MIKKILSTTIALAIVAMITMGYTMIANDGDADTLKNTSELVIDGNKDNVCCPPNWHVISLRGPDDPAAKWDRNGDGCICHKAEGEGNDTPHGNGNDPLFDKSNVKDNNQPCGEGQQGCGIIL